MRSRKESDPRLRIDQAFPTDQTAWAALYEAPPNLELVLRVTGLLWPTFLRVDGYVLLEENYEPTYLEEVQKRCPSDMVEKTINTTYLYDLVGQEGEEFDAVRWEMLGRLLEVTWPEAATLKYPQLSFVATFSWYSPPDDDPGLTIYQQQT